MRSDRIEKNRTGGRLPPTRIRIYCTGIDGLNSEVPRSSLVAVALTNEPISRTRDRFAKRSVSVSIGFNGKLT